MGSGSRDGVRGLHRLPTPAWPGLTPLTGARLADGGSDRATPRILAHSLNNRISQDHPMLSPSPRVLNDFPYPVAYPYGLAFAGATPPPVRRWALCYTEYQLLRLVGLPLVCQYLLEPINETAEKPIGKMNTAIAGLRSPFFSDWIALAYTLREHLPKVGVSPL